LYSKVSKSAQVPPVPCPVRPFVGSCKFPLPEGFIALFDLLPARVFAV